MLFHAKAYGASLGLSALPLFTTLTIYLMLRSRKLSSASRLLKDRTRRLLLPWAGWCVVYGAVKLLDAAVSATPLGQEFPANALIVGTAIHLWFLPFAFAASAVLAIACRSVPRQTLLVASAALFVASVPLCAWAGTGLRLEVPFPQWISVTPAAMAGVLLHSVGSSRRGLLLVAALALAAFGLAAASGFTQGSEQTLVATLAVVAALLAAPGWLRSASGLGRLALGIYLVHPLLDATLRRLGAEALPATAVALIVVALSILATQALSRYRHTRWLV